MLGFFIGLVVLSCKKDEEKKDPYNVPFADYTIEENKANLEDAGVEMVGELDELKEQQAIEVTAELIRRLESTEFEPGTSTLLESNLMFPVLLAQNIENENFNVNNMGKILKSVSSDDPETLEELFDEIVGLYSYDFETDSFIFSDAVTDAVIIEFPGLETDVTNTASLTINDVSDFVPTDPMEGFEDITALPASLHCDLKYNGVVLMEYDFTATYESNGMPTGISSVFSVGPFSFSVNFTHTPFTKASMKYSFTHGDKILIEVYYEQSGNWSEENIETAAEDYDIINSANAYIQVMDIQVKGRVNAKGLADEINKLMEDETLYDTSFINEVVDAANKHLDLIIIYASTNEKIAEAEITVTHNIELECDFWDYYGECLFWSEYNYWEPSVVFIFPDESPVDAETYFDEGFDEFIDAWLDLEVELEETFGSEGK